MLQNKNNISIIKTKLGNFQIIIKNGFIIKILPTNKKEKKYYNLSTKIIHEELNEYLKGKRKYFSSKVNPIGTFFQKEVWSEIKKIKFGQIVTYYNLAQKLNSSPRAIGNACAKNPCLFLIPCHRVVRKNKSIGGFIMGQEIKKKLLLIEGIK